MSCRAPGGHISNLEASAIPSLEATRSNYYWRDPKVPHAQVAYAASRPRSTARLHLNKAKIRIIIHPFNWSHIV
jgi:hypothetical protein